MHVIFVFDFLSGEKGWAFGLQGCECGFGGAETPAGGGTP
jgi:hypothetical protein